jgi:hypothetical protein
MDKIYDFNALIFEIKLSKYLLMILVAPSSPACESWLLINEKSLSESAFPQNVRFDFELSAH